MFPDLTRYPATKMSLLSPVYLPMVEGTTHYFGSGSFDSFNVILLTGREGLVVMEIRRSQQYNLIWMI